MSVAKHCLRQEEQDEDIALMLFHAFLPKANNEKIKHLAGLLARLLSAAFPWSFPVARIHSGFLTEVHFKKCIGLTAAGTAPEFLGFILRYYISQLDPNHRIPFSFHRNGNQYCSDKAMDFYQESLEISCK